MGLGRLPPHPCPPSWLSWETLHNFHIQRLIQEAALRSLPHVLHTALVYYGSRPFLGLLSSSSPSPSHEEESAPAPAPGPIEYEWRSYRQVHLQAIHFLLAARDWWVPLEGDHKGEEGNEAGAGHPSSSSPSTSTSPSASPSPSPSASSPSTSLSWWRQVFSREKQRPASRESPVLVGMCSRNREEWVVMDVGCALGGLVSVPIHTTFSPAQKRDVLENARLSVLVLGPRRRDASGCGCAACLPSGPGQPPELLEEFLQLTEEAHAQGQTLATHWILLEAPCPTALQRAHALGLTLHTWAALLAHGCALAQARHLDESALDRASNPRLFPQLAQLLPAPPPRSEESEGPIYTLMYTSGSTGTPKGVVISCASWAHFLAQSLSTRDPYVTLSFCPLAHGMDRRIIGQTLGCGGRVALYEGEMGAIMPHIQAISPSVFAAVPRFWNRLHQAYLEEWTAVRAQLAPGEEEAGPHEQLLERWSHTLGTRLYQVITGGAPTAPDVLAFLQACFTRRGATVSNGYGATEVGGITHDGHVVRGDDIQVRLEAVPEMGYSPHDRPYPRGEICVKKAHMMSHYYNNPAATRAAYTPDGFFRTGDMGEQVGPDRYRLIARRKHLFKLAQGEFIAPEALENAYAASVYVEQIFVYGNPLRAYPLAVLVPHRPSLEAWWRRTYSSHSHSRHDDDDDEYNDDDDVDDDDENEEKELSWETLCQTEECHQFLVDQLYREGLRQGLAPYEFVRAVVVESEPFTLDNQGLTGPFKVNRPHCERHYHARLEALYAASDTPAQEEAHRARGQRVVQETMRDVMARVLGVQVDARTQGHTSLLQYGLDSLHALQLSQQLESHLGHALPVSQLLNGEHSLDAITHALATHSPLPSALDWSQESLLPASYRPVPFSRVGTRMGTGTGTRIGTGTRMGPPVWTCPTFLLTGATGFLGRVLLESLLTHYPHSLFYCLVRADPSATRARWQQEWGAEGEAWLSRVHLLPGDLSLPRVGLSPARWRQLRQQVHVVIHCGAWVHSVLPYATLRPANVTSTRSLLHFCQSLLDDEDDDLQEDDDDQQGDDDDDGVDDDDDDDDLQEDDDDQQGDHGDDDEEERSKRRRKEKEEEEEKGGSTPKVFHLVSTAGVLGGMAPSSQEGPLPAHHPALDALGGYSQSKWVAERLVTQASERGLRASISRPSRIGPSACAWNPTDYWVLVMSGCIVLQALPDAPHVLWNLTRVDDVAYAIVRMVARMMREEVQEEEEEGSEGEGVSTYNLNTPTDSVSMATLGEWTRQAGYPLQTVPYTRWVARLDQLPATHPLRSLRETFQSASRFPHGPSPPCTQAQLALAEELPAWSGPAYQSRGLSQALYRQLLVHMAEGGHIPPPSSSCTIGEGHPE